MKVVVVGAGKMGLPLACVFASRGASVTAIDVDERVVASINAGRPTFEEPGVDELLAENVRAGRLRATTDIAAATAECDVCVVIVPVMLDEQGAADLRTVTAVSEQLAANLKAGSLVSFETTLPVGTTRDLGAIIARGGLTPGVDFDLAFSPERVKSRQVLAHLFQNPKIVGGINSRSTQRAREFYEEFLGAPVIALDSLEAAELAKLAGMIYRDVNIALANELARYSAAVGVNFEPVREAANTDGEAALLQPGIGVGGHCTPVYPHFLIRHAASRGIPATLAATARAVNDSQPGAMLAQAGDLRGMHVLIFGLGFRPGVKETAYSPAFALRDEVLRRGGIPRVRDPMYTEDEIREQGFDPDGDGRSDVIVLNTAHPEFADTDFSALAGQGAKVVVDGRNFWDPARVRAAGLRYVGVGAPEVDAR